MSGLKLRMTVDDKESREALIEFVREQVRPCVREVVPEMLSDKLVEKVVANFLITDGVKRIAQEMRYQVTQELLKDPVVFSKLEKLDRLAEDAVQKALNDKNLRPLIETAVRRAVGGLLSK